tara:strand:- start:18 stop:440 length:423 start_codon:yes stop_codon:yes gene_type:complete
MVNMKLINVSNTSLSLYKGNRHRKFDAKQSKRHDYGTALCAVCDKVFTKYHQRITTCSEECKREKERAYKRKYREENLEKMKAYGRKYREENREKLNAQNRKYREETCGKSQRKYYEENREKINAQRRALYHAKKKQEEE